MPTKLEMVMVYEDGSPPKKVISVFTWLTTNKLNKVMAYGIGHHAQSHMIL